MEPDNDGAAAGDSPDLLDGEDPGHTSSSPPSSSPSYCADPSSPQSAKGGSGLAASEPRPPLDSDGALGSRIRAATQGHLGLPRRISGPPSIPLHSLPTSPASALGVPRTPAAVPPPSSMPLSTSSMAPGSIVTYVRAHPQGAPHYDAKVQYPCTHQGQQHAQQQQHQQQQQQQYPHRYIQQSPWSPSPGGGGGGGVGGAMPGQSSGAPMPGLQRANSAPPTRSFGQRRSQAVCSSDWAQPAGISSGSAGGGLAVDPNSPGRASESEELLGGNVVKPYGFLPEPATPPPLKPRWPTSRLVSSRRSAAAAFTSFSAAPTAALRITGIGPQPPSSPPVAAASPSSKPPAASARTSPPPKQHQQQQANKTSPKRRFTNSRARCLADNLTFLHRGNTYNPPINERISRLFEVVLPTPSATNLALRGLPSPMTPQPPAPPPPPEATFHLDRALQQRRDAAMAQRNLAEAEGAPTADRLGSSSSSSSRRGWAHGSAIRSLSINTPWLASGGSEWVEGFRGGGGYNLSAVGGSSGRQRLSASGPMPGVVSVDGVSVTEVESGGGGAYGSYTHDHVAAAAAAAADAVRQAGAEALHLQGVSYKAAKAATRALADIHRPGISLRVRAKVEDDRPFVSPAAAAAAPPPPSAQMHQHPPKQLPHPPAQPPPQTPYHHHPVQQLQQHSQPPQLHQHHHQQNQQHQYRQPLQNQQHPHPHPNATAPPSPGKTDAVWLK